MPDSSACSTLPAGRFTLSEAAKIGGHFVYGLAAGDGPVFYIGKTTNAQRRFRNYRKSCTNMHLARRLKGAGDSLRLVVLASNPPDLNAAEAAAILANASELTNIMFNAFHNRDGMQVPVGPAATRMGLCPICDHRIEQSKHRFCNACTAKHIVTNSRSRESSLLMAELAKEFHRAQ